MTEHHPHLTPLDLDRYELGALEADEAARIDAHAARCPACAAQRAQRAQAGARFSAVVFPRTAEKLAARRPRSWWGLPTFALAVPALAVAVIVVVTTRHVPTPSSASAEPETGPTPGIGIKGDPLFHVFVRRNASKSDGQQTVVKVLEGSRLAAGDAVRFVLDPTGLPYVLIASVDGAGQVSIYYPYKGERSARIDAHAPLSVPNSIVLDNAPGPERLFALYTRAPIDARAVRQALAGVATGGAPAIRAIRRVPLEGTVQATLLFEKEPTP